jgi:Icc-related predicted phosphoesterase
MREPLRIAAVGDLHYTRTSRGKLQQAFARVHEHADVLLLCGDLTDYGQPEEAEVLAKDLGGVRVPMVAVLGNHDWEGEQPVVVRDILCEAGVHVLDGESVVVRGVGIVGIKGFCGGFGRSSLEAWGEPAIKQFVQYAFDEAIKLEKALRRLHTERRVVLTHYSPIQGTVVGEPLEIYAFLGSSRLEEPINRIGADVVFHGHAHRGTLEGRTQGGIPVYNVALPLLQHARPEAPLPFRIHEIGRVENGEVGREQEPGNEELLGDSTGAQHPLG